MMKKGILSIFTCFVLLGTTIQLTATSTQPNLLPTTRTNTLTMGNTTLIFDCTGSYRNDVVQIQTMQNNVQPFQGVISCAQSPQHRLMNTASENITTIQEETTKQVIVLKFSSAHELQIKNLSIQSNFSILSAQPTDGSVGDGYYIVDASATLHNWVLAGWMTVRPEEGSLQYFKLGPFIYDNRDAKDCVGQLCRTGTYGYDIALPAGDWYVVYYAGFFDVPNTNTFIQTTITINIIDKPDDLTIMKNEQGIYYGLWCEEFNPLFCLSKSKVFDSMVHGTARFSINNTFLFWFPGAPFQNGSWRIHWKTPTGVKQCMLSVYDNIYNSSTNAEETRWCMFGNGSSGRYKLTTRCADRTLGKLWTTPLFFNAIDVPLK